MPTATTNPIPTVVVQATKARPIGIGTLYRIIDVEALYHSHDGWENARICREGLRRLHDAVLDGRLPLELDAVLEAFYNALSTAERHYVVLNYLAALPFEEMLLLIAEMSRSHTTFEATIQAIRALPVVRRDKRFVLLRQKEFQAYLREGTHFHVRLHHKRQGKR